MDNKKILKFIILLFLGWRIAITIVGYIEYKYFPEVFGTNNIVRHQSGGEYWASWANWDGGHFRGIAENGYLPEQTVFFPGYPLLIKFLMIIGIPSLWGGLAVSNLSLIFALFFLFKITKLEFNEKIAKRATVALLLFPTSFYLGAVYSESLFLAASIGSFYFARTNRFGLASLFAALSLSTRLVGIAVVVGIFIEYLSRHKSIFTRQAFFIFSSFLPLWLYIIYQTLNFNNPLGFLANEVWWERAPSLPWDPLVNFFMNADINRLLIIDSRKDSLFEFSFFVLGIFGLFFTFKKLRTSYFIYFLTSLIIPLFSGTLLAIPRYLLVIFPMYIMLAQFKNKFLQLGILTVFTLLLIFFLGKFINHLWVS